MERRRRSSRRWAHSAVTSLLLWSSSRPSRRKTRGLLPSSRYLHRASHIAENCYWMKVTFSENYRMNAVNVSYWRVKRAKCPFGWFWEFIWNVTSLALWLHLLLFSHHLYLLKNVPPNPFYFNAFQEAESNRLCRRLQLKDIIPVEMQRLTKYPLLLENIAKYTGTVVLPYPSELPHNSL